MRGIKRIRQHLSLKKCIRYKMKCLTRYSLKYLTKALEINLTGYKNPHDSRYFNISIRIFISGCFPAYPEYAQRPGRRIVRGNERKHE